ncbi:MAG: glycosyltransferase family 4 protein [Sphingomonas sp.]|nr:glycosyltransferase family 4 protein [Sphingomonas sp.]
MTQALARAERPQTTIRSIALVTSYGLSLPNFRGPLISALVARGIHVYALAPDFDEKTRAAVIRLGAEAIDISMERTGMRPARDFIDAVRLWKQLRQLKPDATFSYFIKPVIYGSLAARFAGIPRRFAMVAGLGYVFTPDGTRETLKRRVLKVVASVLYKVAFSACRRVFFQNEDDVAQFVDAGLIDPDKVVRLNGTGVDLTALAVSPPIESPPTFLLMARLLREKGIYEYAAAARIVRSRHPEARFLLLGDVDPNPGGLSRDEVSDWVRDGIIEWLGHVDDVRPWIAQSSVYVLPSYREGKPRSTQEAMAVGRAVITTDAPGCRDTVIEGVNGFLVPVRDAQALAQAMLRFIEQPDLIARMGHQSRVLAEERFDVVKINAVILGELGLSPEVPMESATTGAIAPIPAQG